ncbi:hypothetical protein ABT063_48570 [Streptomyces sp. NPDC002838]|uniref:hypothetical protein n=1 Tax=Streptomyces sp. NPDC002838 TaxID=3154436 RepID=UPI003323DA9A
MSDEDRARMLVALNLNRVFMQLSTGSDAYHRQFGWSCAGFRLLNFLWSEGDLEVRELAEGGADSEPTRPGRDP